MNYIRGAVNVISAPYQYYKDLPPINPSTLTGAIDVIVIQRPTDNGDTELVCSPFHVRFGKWQVLRPGDKKVNVSVNGHPIPFNMKIGEAGEAFFVFETDDEVPADLITSPLLQPTRPDKPSPTPGAPPDDLQGLDGSEHIQPGKDGRTYDEMQKREPDTQEPEFLDLDALPSPPQQEDEAFKPVDTTLKPDSRPPLSKKPSQVSISQPVRPAQVLPSPPLTPAHTHSVHNTEEMLAQDKRVDEAIQTAKHNFFAPEVEYHHHITLDAEGYHAKTSERSDHLATTPQQFSFPSSGTSRSSSPSPIREMSHSQPQDPSHANELHVFPTFRAISEPPPDADDHEHLPGPSSQNQTTSPSSTPLSLLSPTQEYSWEWGAFPQPSPMKTTFGGRSWGKGKGMTNMEISGLSSVDVSEEQQDRESEHEHGRSHSVPPELEGSPSKKRKHRELPEDHEMFGESKQVGDSGEAPYGIGDGIGDIDATLLAFGRGGRLKPSPSDPTRFLLSIDGREIMFELSLISHTEGIANVDGPMSDLEESGELAKVRGRRNRYGGPGGTQKLGKLGEMEASRLFSLRKIDFYRFLDDDDLVDDPRLVVRWAGERYIARNDGSPIMRALGKWRDTALLQRAKPGIPVSAPPSDDHHADAEPSPHSSDLHEQVHDRQHHTRSKSEPPEKPPGKRTSSWVQWWNRGRRGKPSAALNNNIDTDERNDKTSPSQGKVERPTLRGTASAPLQDGQATMAPPAELKFEMKRMRENLLSQSAPALPSTPVQTPAKDTAVAPILVSSEAPSAKRKFAKTLRLTSEQLKALNLKPGANPITFSLSASGVIACSARIFVWDSTDLVVVSDIDGTITKSDGLGHVFAMIGRDWTHLGVAKLYTDIRRNGYKVMYLTSRAIGQADATRDYLKGVKQNDYQLPEGPVIMSPDRLMASFHREVIMRKPEVFKMACLRDIQRLFGEASRNPFYAGFGNRITDALSYRSVNVPSARIFTIDSSGEVKMELLELAGYKSSYIHMTDLVDQMFPPIHRKWTPEFTDFNYWKTPVQDFPLPDLSPPSPALSARSDTSNQSALARLRNFSLVSRQSTNRLSPSPVHSAAVATGYSRRSTSPASLGSYDSDDEDGDDLELGADGRRRRRERRRSMTSMPGSLDEMHFGVDEDEEDEPPFSGDEAGEGAEEDDILVDDDVGNEAFDEDLLAAGEMKNVPFL